MVQKIYITGVAGFIGSNLAKALLSEGYTVMGVDNFDPFYDRSIKEDNLRTCKSYADFSFMEGDIRDNSFLKNTFSGFNPDCVVHLAARAGVRPSIIDPESYFDVNVNGTLRVLETMKQSGIRKLIFASSSSVYGNNRKIPFSETDNVDYPVSPYAASKKAGELLCHTYHHLYDLDVFCMRFFTVYGPGQRPDLAINKFTKAILGNSEIPVYGDGTTSRDYTHINDLVNGITEAIRRVKGYEIFNLGNSSPVSLTNLVGLIEKFSGRKARLNFLPMQEGDVFRTYADITKAKEVLNYDPVTDIETGIRDYIDWFKSRMGNPL
ncbi:MAG: GDP-mannose 4,6-dehydratase [Bacteroidales bacterium]